jgi:hypothetical protein
LVFRRMALRPVFVPRPNSPTLTSVSHS